MGLCVRDLVKTYSGRAVVDHVCLDVARGEVVGLLGPNGAGKTTTFYVVVGLEDADSGRVLLDGRNVTAMPMHLRARAGIGYLAQEPSVFRRLTVEQNIAAVLEILNLPLRKRRKRLEELLDQFDLGRIRRQRAYNLSGGERRRVEIARALATQPSYMLLDEPFTGVDPIAVAEIQDIVARLRRDGLGVLITDHSVRETLSIVDRAYIMYEGRILTCGKAADIANDPTARRFYLGDRFNM